MTTSMMNTKVTDTQIKALRTEARQASDDVQIAICNIALGEDEPVTTDDEWEERFGGGWFSRREREIIMSIDSADAARAECARVIADAAAQ